MEVKYTIQAPVIEVYPFFADLIKFGETHPIIFQVDDLGNNEYLIHEELNMFIYKHRFTYKATLESAELNKKVAIFTEPKKGVLLNLIFAFSEANGQTLVEETILVRANPLVKMMFYPILKKSHLQLVNEIKKRLDKHRNRVL